MTMSAIEITAIISVAALMIFFAMRKSNRNRKLNRHEHIREKQEELLEMLRNNNIADTSDTLDKKE